MDLKSVKEFIRVNSRYVVVVTGNFDRQEGKKRNEKTKKIHYVKTQCNIVVTLAKNDWIPAACGSDSTFSQNVLE